MRYIHSYIHTYMYVILYVYIYLLVVASTLRSHAASPTPSWSPRCWRAYTRLSAACSRRPGGPHLPTTSCRWSPGRGDAAACHNSRLSECLWFDPCLPPQQHTFIYIHTYIHTYMYIHTYITIWILICHTLAISARPLSAGSLTAANSAALCALSFSVWPNLSFKDSISDW